MSKNASDVRPEVPIDWLLAVRERGMEAANEIEDLRITREDRLGRPVEFAEAEMIWAMARA